MFGIDQILAISSTAAFREVAVELFRIQARRCRPYAEYLELAGTDLAEVWTPEQIPFMPIELFKSQRIYFGEQEPEAVFTSSTTGGTEPSRHYVARLSDYEATFRAAFSLAYGPASEYSIYALLPGYLEREGSSLIYMADRLIKDNPEGRGGFYLDDHRRLMEDMAADPGRKILLGVSYALWDLAERYPVQLQDTIVMETGGMKGHREELTKERFHDILKEAFGVGTIHSEYGMAELTSQAYSSGGGFFAPPPWMQVAVRDLNDPFDVSFDDGRTGGINIIDLANLHSCAFIQTQDVGRTFSGGFYLLGRADRSEIRGCNLLVQ